MFTRHGLPSACFRSISWRANTYGSSVRLSLGWLLDVKTSTIKEALEVDTGYAWLPCHLWLGGDGSENGVPLRFSCWLKVALKLSDDLSWNCWKFALSLSLFLFYSGLVDEASSTFGTKKALYFVRMYIQSKWQKWMTMELAWREQLWRQWQLFPVGSACLIQLIKDFLLVGHQKSDQRTPISREERLQISEEEVLLCSRSLRWRE